MKGKLIKTEVNYILEDDKGVVIASTSLNKEGLSLSIKNCQAIENGYDLYELAKENYHKFWSVVDESEMLNHTFGYVEGFQKAIELMDDKKFSEEDVILIAEYIRVASQSTPSVKTKDLFDEYQSLQQTEWDVEIVMNEEKEFIFDTAMGISQGHYLDKPKLDATGCLILKRI